MTRRHHPEDIDRLYYGRPMSCAVCRSCFENPKWPGHCIYGGPYSGYLMPDGRVEVVR